MFSTNSVGFINPHFAHNRSRFLQSSHILYFLKNILKLLMHCWLSGVRTKKNPTLPSFKQIGFLSQPNAAIIQNCKFVWRLHILQSTAHDLLWFCYHFPQQGVLIFYLCWVWFFLSDFICSSSPNVTWFQRQLLWSRPLCSGWIGSFVCRRTWFPETWTRSPSIYWVMSPPCWHWPVHTFTALWGTTQVRS